MWHAHIPTIRGKGRPRFGNGRTYTDAATEAYERDVATLCRLARGRDGSHEGWCVVGVLILDLIPSSWSGPRKARAAAQGEPAAARPDVDNIIKAALDGAAGVWFKGDAKVMPPPFRAWTADPARAGLHLYCWPAPTPRDVYAVAYAPGGPWPTLLASLLS